MNMKKVAPLVGAWIEICYGCTESLRHNVAPLVGAWIEIVNSEEIVER